MLQDVKSNKNIANGSQNSVNIDPHQLIHMMVIVQGGELYAYVDNQQVLAQKDNLGISASDVSLMVEQQNATLSSLVEFSNFELDEAS